jgi:sulfhydrogenase subunit beta (sulfur reductase)
MIEQQTIHIGKKLCIEREDFHQLLDTLHAHGYEIIGPTLHNHVIVYDTVDAVADLPIGWTDR